jgi:hypothetical protein
MNKVTNYLRGYCQNVWQIVSGFEPWAAGIGLGSDEPLEGLPDALREGDRLIGELGAEF